MDQELAILRDEILTGMDGTRFTYVEGAGYMPLVDNYRSNRLVVRLDRVLKHHDFLVGQVVTDSNFTSWNFHCNDDDRDWYTYFGGRLCVGSDQTFYVVVEIEK